MSEAEVDLTNHFINKLNDCLNENKFKEALSLFEGNQNDEIVKEYSWDIVPNVSSHLTTENVKYNRDKFECCSMILYAVVEKCDPSKTVLELLEQVEESDDDVKFCIIFKLLTRCFSKMNDKMKAIEWCTSTIRCYIDDLSLRQDSNPSVIIDLRSIKNIYDVVLSFLEPLVNEASLDTSGKSVELRDYLASILIFLLGEPLCYLQEKELESHPEPALPEKIVMLVSRVTSDLLWFLNVAIMRSKQASYKDRNMEEESTNLKVMLFELDKNVPDLAYANFYFYIVTKLHLWEKVPQVYDTKYIFESCTYHIITLLQEQETTEKGLDLMEQLLRKMTNHSLTLQLLKLNIYTHLFEKLVTIMIYNSIDEERRKALSVFQEYIEMFDMEARYLIILHLYQTNEHSGVLSLITGIFKGFVIECLKATPPIPHFLGKNLESLIKLACNLPHGSRSDIVELSDEIIASLNLLRFLFLRDMHNQTGIWYLVEKLQNYFLEPLREAINLCRVYWKVKVKGLETQRKTHRTSKNVELENGSAEVTMTIGGETFPAIPLSDKISYCYQALNGLDVAESILIRVNECIVNNPFKLHSSNRFRSLWTYRALLSDQTVNVNAQQSSEEHSRESDEDYEKNIKSKILVASLTYVHDLGWSQQAISAGAESIGYPGVIHGLFPNRGADLVQYFYLMCNKELNKILKEQASAIEGCKERKAFELQVRDAVETRLRMVIPFKKTWPQALALMALPPNVPMSLANLLTLVDDISYYAGDRSVDINWYTRRVVLAGIYKTTELFMLQDSSQDHERTWNFLERRIKDATQIHSILTTTSDIVLPDQALNRATEAATAAFVTARNILGLNWNR